MQSAPAGCFECAAHRALPCFKSGKLMWQNRSRQDFVSCKVLPRAAETARMLGIDVLGAYDVRSSSAHF